MSDFYGSKFLMMLFLVTSWCCLPFAKTYLREFGNELSGVRSNSLNSFKRGFLKLQCI